MWNRDDGVFPEEDVPTFLELGCEMIGMEIWGVGGVAAECSLETEHPSSSVT